MNANPKPVAAILTTYECGEVGEQASEQWDEIPEHMA